MNLSFVLHIVKYAKNLFQFDQFRNHFQGLNVKLCDLNFPLGQLSTHKKRGWYGFQREIQVSK